MLRDAQTKNEYEIMKQAFVETHNNCPLCGTPLAFVHEIFKLADKVNEKATCPSCKIQIKAQQYLLQ